MCQQITIDFEIISNQKRKNHVLFFYKGIHIADGIDFQNGYYEVRPKEKYFMPLDRLNKMMDTEDLAELFKRSLVKLY